MRSVGRLIGERLAAAGVRYAMGHPGGEVVDLIEGFRAAGLEFVLTRHETAAGFMADAMAASTGIPGVALATLGPGATNLVTGIAQSYLDRSPVLAFTGQLPADRYELVTHQKLELRALYAPITKWQARVSAANAADVVDRALRVALSPRPGPVYLEVPSDVPRQDAADDARASLEPALRTDRGGIATEAVRDAARLLRASTRPLILVGMDANDALAAERVARLAEAWSIPVIDSPKAKGAFAEDHPLFLGTIEMLGTARLFELIDGSDLVLMIGFDPVEFDRDWTARAPVIHVNTVPNDDRYYREAAALVGPIPEAIEALRETAGRAVAKWAAEDVRSIREAFRSFIAPERAGLTAQRALAAIRSVAPAGTIATCDVGYNKAVAGQCWTAYAPKTFFMSNGLSSMGYALPAAVGLKLVHRDRPLVAIAGDGGFAMTMGELETAARLRLPVVVLVLADDALSQIRAGQERRGYPPTGTTFGALDYTSIAKGFGARGYDVSTEAECASAAREALAAGVPSLIAAHIDATAYQLG